MNPRGIECNRKSARKSAGFANHHTTTAPKLQDRRIFETTKTKVATPCEKSKAAYINLAHLSGGVLVSTGGLKDKLRVEVDRLAS